MKTFKLKNKAEGKKKKNERKRGKGRKATGRQESKGLGPVLD